MAVFIPWSSEVHFAFFMQKLPKDILYYRLTKISTSNFLPPRNYGPGHLKVNRECKSTRKTKKWTTVSVVLSHALG